MSIVTRLFLPLLGLLAAGPIRAADSSADAAMPKIVQTRSPLFPPALEASGFDSGEARIAVQIDATGHLTDFLVVGYTRRQFADEALKAVKVWTFASAQSAGRAAGWTRELQIGFQTKGARVVSDNLEHPAGKLAVLNAPDDQLSYRAYALSELDRIPSPVSTPAPEGYPSRPAHPVVVDFYINEQGEVRLPVIRQAEDAAFADAALVAVARWRFAPPTRAGAPVLVHATQTFVGKSSGPSGN